MRGLCLLLQATLGCFFYWNSFDILLQPPPPIRVFSPSRISNEEYLPLLYVLCVRVSSECQHGRTDRADPLIDFTYVLTAKINNPDDVKVNRLPTVQSHSLCRSPPHSPSLDLRPRENTPENLYLAERGLANLD